MLPSPSGGLARSATQTVIALSRGSKIRTYRTWAEFETFCEQSVHPSDKLAQRAASAGWSQGPRSRRRAALSSASHAFETGLEVLLGGLSARWQRGRRECTS